MSIIGSAWGQETFTVEENTAIPTAGQVVQHVTDGFVTVQYASEQVTSGDIAEFAIRSTSNNEHYIATTKGKKEFEYQDGVVKGGTFFALKSTRSGQITVKLYNGKTGEASYRIYVISGGNLEHISTTATFTEKTLGTHTMDIEADVIYYFYTNGTGSTGFGGYTFTPSAPTLTIGNSEAVADYTYVYDNESCDIGTNDNDQMNNNAKSGSSFKFKVTPEVSGTYSFTSFISTAFSGRYVSLYNGETLIEKKELTTYSGDANVWTQGKDYTWSVANLEAGQTYEMKVVCEKGTSATDDNNYTANVYKMRIVRTPDKTGLIQIPVDMFNISANTTAGDGFDRFYRGVNLNFAGNAVVSEGKNMVTLGAATDKLAAGSITVTVPDQTDADSEYIQQVQFNVNGGIITDDNKTTLLKVYNGDTEITGGTWNASGTNKLIWDAPADVRTLSLKFVDNADEANTPAITQVLVNVYEVKTLANSGRLGTVMPAFSKSEVSMRNNGVKYTNSLGKVKVNGSEYNNFEVLYTFETTITEYNEDGRTYYSLTRVTTDPVTGSTINPATGQVTTGATAGTVKVIAYYDGLQEGSTDKANYAYNPVKAEYTLNVVAPAVIEIGDEEKVAKNIHVQEYNKCSINGTWLDGQLMDSSTDGAYVTFKVKPTVDGTYTFTSQIGTILDNRTVTLICNDGTSDVFTETKDITNNGNWTNNLGSYTWTVSGLEAGTEYTIKLLGNKKTEATDNNGYVVNIYPMTIVRVVTATTTTFNVSDFRYAGQSSSRDQILDRTIGGFSFTYTGGEAIKYNADNNFFFREGSAGTLTIAPTDANNKITQIVIGSTTDVSAVTGFTVTADGNPVTPVLANGSITIDVPAGASSVVISTNELSATVKISSYTISTTDQPSEEPYQPVFTFDHASLTVAKTGGVSNALTTTPKNYPVTFNSSNEAVATVNGKGEVTLVAAGNTTITVSSTATEYFNAANASYTLTVVDDESVAGKTWDFTTWSTEDIAIVDGDDSTWEYNNNGYHKNKTGTSSGPTDFDLAVMEGLLFTTTGSDQIRIYPNTDGQTDGSIRLQSKNAKIYMPELKAGQTITLTMMTASESSARGMVFSGAGADKVQLIYGAETSKTMNVVTYRVTENIDAEQLIMSASTGGLYLYSIKLGYSELYWTDGSNTVTDVAVTAEGETSYTLNSAVDASYTITDANGNESTDVEVVDGKVIVNTFTPGNTHTITATVDGHSATLTLRMVYTATISYDVTTAEGTLGFSFVEPVLTKNPEGLNVVKWKSSNPEVATVVAETGEVTFVSAGEAKITAYIEENNYYAYQEASYTLTVNEAEGVQEPWTLSLVKADGESVAVGSTGHKLTMTAAGTIKAGQVTNAIPGLTLSFGRTGDADWEVYQENDHFGGLFVAGRAMATLASDTDENASGYLPTGGTYLGLEPTVNGVLSLHTAYYKLQQIVVVDKETNTIIASRRPTDGNHFEDYEFTVPLQADHTYYVYNFGNPNRGDAAIEATRYAMSVNAITFTPVFLDRIGHVIVKNNEYNITGAQLADDIHDYPTFSNVHAEEGGSVHYHSDSEVIYLDEDGNLVIDGEGTATLQASVSHVKDDATCSSVAQCTVTYAKSQLKFSGSTFDVATNLVDEFVEPTLVLPEVLKGVDAEYSISAGSIDSETGNVTKLEGTTATVTATIADNLYYNPTAKYIINILAAMVPFTVIEEITIPVGTRAFSLLRDNVYGGTTPAITLNDGTMYGDDKNLTWGSWIGSQDYQGSINKFFDHKNFTSTDVSVAKATGRMEIDALSEGTTTVTYTSRKYNGGAYAATPVVIKVNVVKDTDADYYEDVYNGSKATYRAWNFNQGFSAEELGRYNGSYTPLTNQSGEADNFITHLPDANAFWIYDEANNTLKSNTFISVSDDNKIDRESVAFIANEPMNLLTPAVTSYNCFGKSSGKMESAREVGKEDTYDYNDGDEDVLTFFTFRTATDVWEDSNGDGKIQLNTVSDITFNTTTTLTPITGVGSGENATPYKAINLGGKAAAIRVNDIKPGMWMAVIADNTVVPGEELNVGRVQLASDGAIEQAVGQTLYDSYKDSKDADLKKYATNRVTNIFPYLKSAKGATTAAIEQEGAYGVTNIIVGYPAGMGTMNIGGGEKSPKINNIQRTYGYATFVSPYNIDLTGQTALKAYICDYYGRDNNIVHLVQIKHIPARTPVVLKGYARDRYILFMSEGNQDVEHGLSDEVFAKNRLVGAVDEPITVNPTEVGLAPDGSVTTWHHFGLTKNKFLAYTKAGTLAQGRAYMRLTQEEYEDLYASEVSASATSADAMKVIFEDIDFDYSVGDNTTTGIENVEKNTRFEGDGYYYTLNGVRVNGMPTQKGIYIHNGRKIVVR